MRARSAPRRLAARLLIGFGLSAFAASVLAQSVCLPAPRLLTTLPMGGKAGASVEVAVTGENIDDASELRFSHPGITATPKKDDKGKVLPRQFVVTLAKDVPVGVHDARVMTRLGISSARAFSVGKLPEVTRTQANTSQETAMELQPNSICNAAMTRKAVDYYSFPAKKDQRLVVDCAAPGIDSKLNPVVIVADSEGRDLQVERTGGAIDFTAPEEGTYFIKVHDLTFQGGPHYFYRLAIVEAGGEEIVPRLPATRGVNSFSWVTEAHPAEAALKEAEPNNEHAAAQKISLPCDIAGSFFPAADVDTFEFTAKKGDEWWVEVASQRLGLPTDPFILVQQVVKAGDEEKLADVAELSDIASPVKRSSNGYSYDGPPYNAGSSDILGKLEIKEDGVYRMQLRDLFGGTRRDPRNIYRLIVRKAEPDFALVAWALHMNLRNGDRNALSKPIALRGGSTMAFEVVVVRKDGFNGEIELGMEGLPKGVSAGGLRIPAGKSRGIMLITATEDAPAAVSNAGMFGVARIGDKTVRRPCRLASMAWPVRNAWSEVPSPRLLAGIPVSVGSAEPAPLTLAPKEKKVWEVAAGGKLTIPLKLALRSEFSGATLQLKTFGAGFDGMKAFDIPLKDSDSEAVLDTAALKTPPGDYLISFYGSAVAKYRDKPGAKPKDIVDIYATEAIPVRVQRAEKELSKLSDPK